MTTKEELLKYKSIDELLDNITTEKETGIKRVFNEIGSYENGYASFKSRHKIFKEVVKRDLPELTTDEILKFHKYYNKLKDTIYVWNGFDILLQVLEWEELKKKYNKDN